MASVSSIALVFLVVVTAECRMNPTTPYTHSATLEIPIASEVLYLYWNFTDTHITFELHGNTTGWVGIGFSPSGSMVKADIVVGWVKNGVVTITDRYGPDNENLFPNLDPKQDIDVLGGAECDGWTMIKFSRQLAACEVDYDREITTDTQRVIFAIGQVDPAEDDITAEYEYFHGPARGSKSMYLLSRTFRTSSKNFSGPDYHTFDIVAQNLNLPPKKTYYNCRIIKLPDLNEKHHIVQFEPVIQKENVAYVHHILVMSCPNEPGWSVGADVHCGTNTRKPCYKTIIGWAVGGTAAVLPDETGFPIGRESNVQYVMLETHYDNQEERTDIVDNSGIRITYTSNLRTHDSGIITLGQLAIGQYHFIPPGADSFRHIGVCGSQCLKKRMMNSGVQNITLYRALLHSHLTGVSLRIRHIRNGIELPHIAYDGAYDFDYQEFIYLDPFIILEPGDELQMECVYRTTDRTNVTQAGDATSEEMCFAFLGYYPKIDLPYCVSVVLNNESFNFFGIEAGGISGVEQTLENFNISTPTNLTGKTAFDVINEYNWTTENIKKFENYINAIPPVQVCGGDSGQEQYRINHLNITAPYVIPTKNCSEPDSPLQQSQNASDCPVSVTGASTTTPAVTTTTSASSRTAAHLSMIFFLFACWSVLAEHS